MKRVILLGLLVAGCGPKVITPPPAVRVQEVVRTVEVQRPCNVTVPTRPRRLGALPSDAVALAAVLGAKLAEWSGAGGYGERADRALRECTKK
jgi:hypothetical protein